MIVALVGRRVDDPQAETPRFPLAHRERVRDAVRVALVEAGATALVASGACGADLIGHEVAGALGLRRRMVLPFDRGRFRESSVVDRPGDWGEVFDRVADEVAREGGLIVLGRDGENQEAYLATNLAILDEAGRLAGAGDPGGVLAVVAWDGRSRGGDDVTAAFLDQARARDIPVTEVSTLGPP